MTSYDQLAFDLIVALRGGLPDRCDFCGEPYTDQRHPIPEEAGEWACSECWARWYPEISRSSDGSAGEASAK